jgi:quercetin dioxygenase-like cupin family protein
MREGEVAHPNPGETIRCIRSGQGGGAFIFELELAPGTKGPPTHTHDEGDETIEVLEGEIAFRVRGKVTTLRKGESLRLTPSDPHTFWNPSKTARVLCVVHHGARFERLIAQPSFTTLAMYLAFVDRGASRASNPAVSAVVWLVALLGRLRGQRPVVAPA